MPLPLIFLGFLVLEKAFGRFTQLLNAYMTIIDMLANHGFSLFIALDSDDEKVKDELLKGYATWIYRAIKLCPAECFIMANYELIKRDPDIENFLMQDQYLRWTLQGIDRGIKENNKVDDPIKYLSELLQKTGYNIFQAIWDLITQNPLNLLNEIASRFNADMVRSNYDPRADTKAFDMIFKTQAIPPPLPIAKIEILTKLNPFLPFLSPQILAHIKSLLAFAKVIAYKKCIKPSEQFLNFLHADVYFEGNLIDKIKLQDRKLTYSIPKAWLKPGKLYTLCFDYAGLTKCVQFGLKLRPVKLTCYYEGIDGGAVCNVQKGLTIGMDLTNWTGNDAVNCNSIYGGSYTLRWIEIEHNQEDNPFYLTITCGAYREACVGTAKLYVGYREGDKLYLTPVTDIWGTWLIPAPITLYGRFPSPRFVIALYHYCPIQTVSVTGVRIQAIRGFLR